MQLENEIQLWGRTLNDLQQENIQMKNRLSDIIKGIADSDMLDEVESFLNRFISKDAVFAIMRYDIAEHLKKIKGCSIYGHLISQKHEVLQKDLEKIVNEVKKLKMEFEEYLSARNA